MAETSSGKLSGRRRSIYRLLAVLLGLFAVLLLEGALRLTGLGRVQDIDDPFVGFSEKMPLFVIDRERDQYFIPKSRQVFFQPDSFSARKGPNEFRIFCLGGSTVQGRPYSIETSFTTWLELSLRAADPAMDWQVVNCGGVSYASYRLLPIMQEVLDYEPDMFIVYTGHNEFLEERSYTNIKHQPPWLLELQERVSNTRIYGVMSQLSSGSRANSAPVNLPAEVDALLDYEGGLETYHRDDAWRDQVILHYEHNLRGMARIAHQAGVRLLFVNPVSNIRDTPPFKVEPASQLTEQQQQEFQRLWQLAKASSWDNLPTKAGYLHAALAIDGRHAEAHFLLAKVYESLGEIENAKREYLRAKDEDICPLRMLESMHEALQRVAKLTDTPLVDVRGFLEGLAEHGIPGDDQLIDHVHPRIPQHQQIAKLLLEQMVRENLVTLEAEWADRRKQLYNANFSSLADNYFPESVERLRGLKKWAQGRVTRLRVENRGNSDRK